MTDGCYFGNRQRVNLSDCEKIVNRSGGVLLVRCWYLLGWRDSGFCKFRARGNTDHKSGLKFSFIVY